MTIPIPSQALILAAGLGTRLAPVTDFIPKPLVPFFGVPLIDCAVLRLVRAGVDRIAINTHHLASQMETYIREQLATRFASVEFHVVQEPVIRGTGGAISNLRSWFDRRAFWVVNSDAVFLQDLTAIAKAHNLNDSQATLMVSRHERHRDMRFLKVDHDGGLVSRLPEARDSGFVFCGIHLNNWEILSILPQQGMSCVLRQGHLPWVEQGGRVRVFESEDFWADLGTPERYLEAHYHAYPYLSRWIDEGLFSPARMDSLQSLRGH